MPKPFKQEIILELDDKTTPKVEKAQGAFGKFGSFLKSSFAITLGDITAILGSVAGAISGVVEAAQVQEDAVRKLDQSLSSLGPTAGAVSEQLQAQAAALELTTRFSDEAIIANQALALNLGVSAKDAAKLTEAAVELSAATGRSLESSFVNLARTLNGFRGELGELVPEVAVLGVESLKSGAALDVVLDRLGGSAAGDVKTFSGLVTQLGNAWGTVKEELGKAITENEGITQALGRLKELITSREFLDSITAIAEGFASITLWFAEAAAKANQVQSAFRNVSRRIDELKARIIAVLGPIGTLVSFLGDTLVSQAGLGFKALGDLADVAGILTDKFIEAGEATDDYGASTEAATPKIESWKDVNISAGNAVQDRAEQEAAAAESVKKLKEETDAAVAASLSYEQAERNLRNEVEQTTQSLINRAAAANTTGGGGGSGLGASQGIFARDPRQQGEVDAALAAGQRPYFGGTRIRTADGTGSRLLR